MSEKRFNAQRPTLNVQRPITKGGSVQLTIAEQHLLEGNPPAFGSIGYPGWRGVMIRVAGHAIGCHFPGRAVTGYAIGLRGHQNIGSITALHRVVTIIALHAGVFGVVEVRLRHPAIDQKWLGNCRRGVGHCLYVVAKRAAREIRARRGGCLLLRFIRIGCEEHSSLQLFTRAELLAQLPDLLRHKRLNFALAGLAFFQTGVIGILRR